MIGFYEKNLFIMENIQKRGYVKKIHTVSPTDIPDLANTYKIMQIKRDWYTASVEAMEKAVAKHLG